LKEIFMTALVKARWTTAERIDASHLALAITQAPGDRLAWFLNERVGSRWVLYEAIAGRTVAPEGQGRHPHGWLVLHFREMSERWVVSGFFDVADASEAVRLAAQDEQDEGSYATVAWDSARLARVHIGAVGIEIDFDQVG
jgi:hypothetical protein